jgi:hypothetical protein
MKMLNINDFYNRKIVTYDEYQNRIGSSSREEVHYGLWHKGVQLNILFGNEILLQLISCRYIKRINRSNHSRSNAGKR